MSLSVVLIEPVLGDTGDGGGDDLILTSSSFSSLFMRGSGGLNFPSSTLLITDSLSLSFLASCSGVSPLLSLARLIICP